MRVLGLGACFLEALAPAQVRAEAGASIRLKVLFVCLVCMSGVLGSCLYV
jgi:hypothetical protein